MVAQWRTDVTNVNDKNNFNNDLYNFVNFLTAIYTGCIRASSTECWYKVLETFTSSFSTDIIHSDTASHYTDRLRAGAGIKFQIFHLPAPLPTPHSKQSVVHQNH